LRLCKTATMPSAPRWQREQPEIRASDAERERVVAFLRDKAAEGRLTPDELDERVGHAYASVTRGELRRLVRDLPDPPFRSRALASRRPRSALPVLAIGGLAALRLPALLWVLAWSAIAVTVTLIAIIAVIAVALGPFIALFVLAILAMRRRHGRYGAMRFH
jgi:DUF1707 SHOCT-like domain